MTSPLLEVRSRLQPALLPWLGTYTLANGAETPAFSVRAAGENLPTGTRVSGVEAVLQLHPALGPVRQYSDEEALGIWTLFLVDWEGSADLTAAAQKVIRTFPGSTYVEPNVPEGLGPRNQVRMTLRTQTVLPFVSRAHIVPPATTVAVAGVSPGLLVE